MSGERQAEAGAGSRESAKPPVMLSTVFAQIFAQWQQPQRPKEHPGVAAAALDHIEAQWELPEIEGVRPSNRGPYGLPRGPRGEQLPNQGETGRLNPRGVYLSTEEQKKESMTHSSANKSLFPFVYKPIGFGDLMPWNWGRLLSRTADVDAQLAGLTSLATYKLINNSWMDRTVTNRFFPSPPGLAPTAAPWLQAQDRALNSYLRGLRYGYMVDALNGGWNWSLNRRDDNMSPPALATRGGFTAAAIMAENKRWRIGWLSSAVLVPPVIDGLTGGDRFAAQTNPRMRTSWLELMGYGLAASMPRTWTVPMPYSSGSWNAKLFNAKSRVPVRGLAALGVFLLGRSFNGFAPPETHNEIRLDCARAQDRDATDRTPQSMQNAINKWTRFANENDGWVGAYLRCWTRGMNHDSNPMRYFRGAIMLNESMARSSLETGAKVEQDSVFRGPLDFVSPLAGQGASTNDRTHNLGKQARFILMGKDSSRQYRNRIDFFGHQAFNLEAGLERFGEAIQYISDRLEKKDVLAPPGTGAHAFSEAEKQQLEAQRNEMQARLQAIYTQPNDIYGANGEGIFKYLTDSSYLPALRTSERRELFLGNGEDLRVFEGAFNIRNNTWMKDEYRKLPHLEAYWAKQCRDMALAGFCIVAARLKKRTDDDLSLEPEASSKNTVDYFKIAVNYLRQARQFSEYSKHPDLEQLDRIVAHLIRLDPRLEFEKPLDLQAKPPNNPLTRDGRELPRGQDQPTKPTPRPTTMRPEAKGPDNSPEPAKKPAPDKKPDDTSKRKRFSIDPGS